MTSPTTSTSHAGQPYWFLTMQGSTLALLLTFLLSFSAAPFLTPTSVRARFWALQRHLWRLLLSEEDGFLRDSLVDGELKTQPMVTEFSSASETFTEAITKTMSCVCKKVLYVMLTPKRRHVVWFWIFIYLLIFFLQECYLIFSVNKQTKLFFSYFNYYQLRMIFLV